MGKPAAVDLPPRLAEFVDREVAEGRYESAEDVVAAGLDLLARRQAELAELRAALIEGERSGKALPFDVEAFLAERRERRA